MVDFAMALSQGTDEREASNLNNTTANLTYV